MTQAMRSEPVAEDPALTRLRSVMRSVLEMEERRDVDVSAITADTPLSDLPIDSLARMYLISGVEEAFDVEIPDEAAVSFTTVRSIIDYVREARSASAAIE